MADEATDAMIAQALWAAENTYYDYGVFGGGSSDDSDYGGKRKKKQQAKKARTSRASKKTSEPSEAVSEPAVRSDAANAVAEVPAPNQQSAEPNTGADEDQEQDDVAGDTSATGRRKRKDLGQKRERGRPWSDEEELKYTEALDLHGRDWKKCADHIGTRDCRAVASHAQKHFIKLCLTGQPLPPKVAETGIGYTLSGKLLDPNSAAGKAYGFKPELILKLEGSALETALAGLVREDMPPVDQSALDAATTRDQDQQARKSAAKPPAKRRKKQEDSAEPAKPPSPPKPQPAATAEVLIHLPPIAPEYNAAPVQTEYARNRPRRETAGQRLTLGTTTESLELVKCSEFVGPPGSGAPLSQPFAVDVATEVMIAMEFHAHLSSCEIIGLLGGCWDPERRCLSMSEAYPCARAAGSDARTSVELDAGAEVEARALMEAKGQRCVGWYHSHPVFEPSPSLKDMENQRNYQALFRDDSSNMEPFVGVILGPYDLAMPQPLTAITFFVVQQKGKLLQPFNIRCGLRDTSNLPSTQCQAKLDLLLDMFREDIGRIDFTESWRPFTSLNADGAVSGSSCSKLQKLLTALRYHLTRADKAGVEDFLHQLCVKLQERWQLALGLSSTAVTATEQTNPATLGHGVSGEPHSGTAATSAAPHSNTPAGMTSDDNTGAKAEQLQPTDSTQPPACGAVTDCNGRSPAPSNQGGTDADTAATDGQ
eukprot:jgi/Chrzof1/435/Cz01g15230.t1